MIVVVTGGEVQREERKRGKPEPTFKFSLLTPLG